MGEELIDVDILNFVRYLRQTYGYAEQNFKRYHTQLTALLPNLRHTVAPHHKNYSKPFLYKDGVEMVIFRNELAQLIAVEAERAIATAGEYLSMAYSSGAIRHRRRAVQRYYRAVERYYTLSTLVASRGTSVVQCYATSLLSQIMGVYAAENDDFFEGIKQFSRALRAVRLCGAESATLAYFEAEIGYRLEHCIYIATVFADGDQSIMQQITDLQQDTAGLPSEVLISEKRSSAIRIWGRDVELPLGNASRVIRRVLERERAMLEADITPALAQLREYYLKQAYQALKSTDFYLAPFFAQPVLQHYISRQGESNAKFECARPHAVKLACKCVSGHVRALSDIYNVAKQFSERAGANKSLVEFTALCEQRLCSVRCSAAELAVMHTALSLVSARFQFKHFGFVRAFAYTTEARSTLALQTLAKARGGFDAVLAALFQCKLATMPNTNIQPHELLLQAAALLKLGLSASRAALTEYQQAVVSICALPQVLDGIELAANVKQLREDAKSQIPDVSPPEFAFLGTVLPNPVYFDAIPEIISIEDIFG